jgi:chromosome segregation ATPase
MHAIDNKKKLLKPQSGLGMTIEGDNSRLISQEVGPCHQCSIEEVYMNQGSEFDRLDQYVGRLLAQYDQLLEKTSQLQSLLRQKEDEIRQLQGKVSSADSERGDISNRIKGLIDQIEEWQSAALEPEEQPPANETTESAVAVGNDTVFRHDSRGEERESTIQRNLFHVERQVDHNSSD